MHKIVAIFMDPIARAVREIDAALAGQSIANARAAAQESARRRAMHRAVGAAPDRAAERAAV